MSVGSPAACKAQPQRSVASTEEQASSRESVKPGINDSFLDPDLKVDDFVKRFEVESREVFAARKEVLKALELSLGDRVADIGAGTGLYTTLFADQVGPTGGVYAIEIVPAFVTHLRSIAQQHQQSQVTPVLGDEDDIRLPPETIDLAFTCDVYHHFEYPQPTLASIQRALRPGGRFVVIDFEKIPGVTREWTMDHVRADKATVRDEIERAGFEFVVERKIAGFRENYLLIFRKPAAK